MKNFCLLFLSTALLLCSCGKVGYTDSPDTGEESLFSLSDIARILSELPLQKENLDEVFDAVNASSGNGYDEEYMMSDLFNAPGSGVGGTTRASRNYTMPLKDLLEDYFSENYVTKSGAADVQRYINSLSSSDIQIYWPYSEDWDGDTYPIITYDPGFGAESNYGYEVRMVNGKLTVTDSVLVTESVALSRPVWVINRNDDASFTPADMFETKGSTGPERVLKLKSFKALRNYDSWFGGASEFLVKCGAPDGFYATNDDDLKLYTPSVTDCMIVVKRKDCGKEIPFDAILLTDYTEQMDKIAFLIVEDDGGKTTSWKCAATVKYKSKSYGFDMEIPYKDKDDIVWRGQLSQNFFPDRGETSGRFGDVMVTFELP